jgi:hypothetical protein
MKRVTVFAFLMVGVTGNCPLIAQQMAADTARRIPMERAVIVNAEPGTFQVVSVPVPEALRQDSILSFVVTHKSAVTLLGTAKGEVSVSKGSVLITLGVPRGGLAGSQEAALVVFRSETLGQVGVPILLNVAVARKVLLDVRERITGIRAGEDIDLSPRLANAGNAQDTLRIELILPEGWRLPKRGLEPAALTAGASATRPLVVRVPASAQTGDHFLQVRITGSDSAHAEQLVTLAVGETLAGDVLPGAVVEASLSTVSVDAGIPHSIAQIGVNGPLTGAINIDGRASLSPTLESAALRGLARVGAYVADPRLSLWSDRWRLNLGYAYGSISDLTGTNTGGNGVSFNYDNDRHQVSGLAARSMNGDGALIGGRVAVDMFGARLGASASNFDGGRLDPRRLTAGGVDALVNTRLGLFGGAVAYRDYLHGSGVGLSSSFERVSESGHFAAHVQHAPGGTGAFARALDEIQLTGDRWFGNFNVSGTWFGTRDENAAFPSITSNAWAIAPQYRLSGATTVRVDVRGSAYDARGETPFGNSDTRVSAGLASRVGAVFYSADLSIGALSRSLELDGERFTSSGSQYGWRLSASYANELGRLQVDQSYDWNSAGVELAPNQLNVIVRADQVRLPSFPAALELESEIGYAHVGQDRSYSTARAGASYRLPHGVRLRSSLEYNSLYANSQGSTPLMFAVRFEKTLGLPRLAHGSATGRVFQDLNANGVRDAGEEGVPHVTVRQGSVRTTSDRNGELVFWQSSRGEVTVDPGTLPYGWVVGEVKGSNARNIPLVPTSAVRVILDLAATERARGVDLTNTIVSARDAQGREWTARRVAADTALFDVLPVGEYTLRFDFSLLAEPMRVEGEPAFTVRGRGVETVAVPVLGRPLRFKKGSGQP